MILTYTNTDSFKNKFKNHSFIDIEKISDQIKNNINNIKMASVLIGPSADIWDRIVFAKIDDNKVIGLLCLAFNETGFKFNKEHQYACTFVTTDVNYQGKGIAKELINEMFNFASTVNIPRIKSSSYEVDFIEKTFLTVASKYPNVELINPDTPY